MTLEKIAYLIVNNELIKKNDSCFELWRQNEICENCISMRAYEDDTTVKNFFSDSNFYC